MSSCAQCQSNLGGRSYHTCACPLSVTLSPYLPTLRVRLSRRSLPHSSFPQSLTHPSLMQQRARCISATSAVGRRRAHLRLKVLDGSRRFLPCTPPSVDAAPHTPNLGQGAQGARRGRGIQAGPWSPAAARACSAAVESAAVRAAPVAAPGAAPAAPAHSPVHSPDIRAAKSGGLASAVRTRRSRAGRTPGRASISRIRASRRTS